MARFKEGSSGEFLGVTRWGLCPAATFHPPYRRGPGGLAAAAGTLRSPDPSLPHSSRPATLRECPGSPGQPEQESRAHAPAPHDMGLLRWGERKGSLPCPAPQLKSPQHAPPPSGPWRDQSRVGCTGHSPSIQAGPSHPGPCVGRGSQAPAAHAAPMRPLRVRLCPALGTGEEKGCPVHLPCSCSQTSAAQSSLPLPLAGQAPTWMSLPPGSPPADGDPSPLLWGVLGPSPGHRGKASGLQCVGPGPLGAGSGLATCCRAGPIGWDEDARGARAHPPLWVGGRVPRRPRGPWEGGVSVPRPLRPWTDGRGSPGGRGKAAGGRPFAFESPPGALSGRFKGRPRGRGPFPGAPRPPPPLLPVSHAARPGGFSRPPPLPRLGKPVCRAPHPAAAGGAGDGDESWGARRGGEAWRPGGEGEGGVSLGV
ncbi:hypothetical protein P7K49_002210 [Saguinus oedipus]|uniref:Uncharacterized protein n=1 Tax=Saguinus oedipus TaxID=9490 RepID=A0ABQ9WGP9_SAGOE|nr:hypothetical protein P7K49_002210 [Saguinus oedipus]